MMIDNNCCGGRLLEAKTQPADETSLDGRRKERGPTCHCGVPSNHGQGIAGRARLTTPHARARNRLEFLPFLAPLSPQDPRCALQQLASVTYAVLDTFLWLTPARD